jgi:hypothetical protein
LLILLLNLIQPAYMNARHLAILAGIFTIAVGGGMGLLWCYQRVLTTLVALVLTAG